MLPGGQPGTVRLQSVSTKQSLYFDGLFVGCCGEPYRNQDWVVEPRAPWYVGEFVKAPQGSRGTSFVSCRAVVEWSRLHLRSRGYSPDSTLAPLRRMAQFRLVIFVCLGIRTKSAPLQNEGCPRHGSPMCHSDEWAPP